MIRHVARSMVGSAVLAGMLGFAGAAFAQEVKSPTMDAIKKRGQLICGVDTGIPGFAFQDSAGKWQGLDVAYCRAIAVAVLGDPDKVKYIGTTSKVRFSVLQSGEIDVLIRDSTHDAARATPSSASRPARQLLHRPDLHGAQVPERRARQGAERRHDLRADRHHARAQHRRLRPCQQHQDQYVAVREARGSLRGGRGRPLRRLHR